MAILYLLIAGDDSDDGAHPTAQAAAMPAKHDRRRTDRATHDPVAKGK
jgi:hypothetical protein